MVVLDGHIIMDMDNIITKLHDMGFVFNKQIYPGKLFRVGTIRHRYRHNGWFIIGEHNVNYGSWSGEVEKGWFAIDDTKYNNQSVRDTYLKLSEAEAVAIANFDRQLRLAIIQADLAKIKPTSNKSAYMERKLAHIDRKVVVTENHHAVIKLYNQDREIVGYQTINEDGFKRFREGSICDGAFFPLCKNKMSDCTLLLLVEGYATGSSVYQAIQHNGVAVIVCFSAHNVQKVYNALQNTHKGTLMYYIRDFDDAGLAVPVPGVIVTNPGEDANDCHVKHGLRELSDRINNTEIGDVI